MLIQIIQITDRMQNIVLWDRILWIILEHKAIKNKIVIKFKKLLLLKTQVKGVNPQIQIQ